MALAAPRLAASRIDGSGTLSAAGRAASCNGSSGANGRVRLEAFQQLFGGNVEVDARSATPFDTFIPTATASPALRVISVGGVNVTPFPAGTFEAPDVTINSDVAVPIVIETKNVPAGIVTVPVARAARLDLSREVGLSPSMTDLPTLSNKMDAMVADNFANLIGVLSIDGSGKLRANITYLKTRIKVAKGLLNNNMYN